jgi:hypothetical protein
MSAVATGLSALEAYHLDLDGSPDALARVLVTLRRRQCVVERLEFELGQLKLAVRTPCGREDRVAQWLSNLVSVLSVTRE